MVLQFDTNKSEGTTVTLPLYRTVNVTVNWGDGNRNTYTEAGNQDHTFAAEGTYTVSISGSLEQFGQIGYPNADKLVAVTSFGNNLRGLLPELVREFLVEPSKASLLGFIVIRITRRTK